MMSLVHLGAVTKPLTADGLVGYVQVDGQDGLYVGAEVVLSAGALSAAQLRITDIRCAGPHTTNVLVYLIDEVTGLPFDATAYTMAAGADLTVPEQSVWGGLDLNGKLTYYNDTQWKAILAAVLPAGGGGPGGNASVGSLGVLAPTSGTLLAGVGAGGLLRAPSVINTTPTGAEYGLVVRMAGGASGGTSSVLGAAIPSDATAAGFSNGSTLQTARVFDLDSAAGLQYVLGVSLRATGPGGSTELLGQQTMAGSLPVTLASDQAPIPITAPAVPVLSGVAQSVVSAQVLAANLNRNGIQFFNNSSSNLYVRWGAVAGATVGTYNIRVPAFGTYEVWAVFGYTGVVSAVWDTAGTGHAEFTDISK